MSSSNSAVSQDSDTAESGNSKIRNIGISAHIDRYVRDFASLTCMMDEVLHNIYL